MWNPQLLLFARNGYRVLLGFFASGWTRREFAFLRKRTQTYDQETTISEPNTECKFPGVIHHGLCQDNAEWKKRG